MVDCVIKSGFIILKCAIKVNLIDRSVNNVQLDATAVDTVRYLEE